MGQEDRKFNKWHRRSSDNFIASPSTQFSLYISLSKEEFLLVPFTGVSRNSLFPD